MGYLTLRLDPNRLNKDACFRTKKSKSSFEVQSCPIKYWMNSSVHEKPDRRCKEMKPSSVKKIESRL